MNTPRLTFAVIIVTISMAAESAHAAFLGISAEGLSVTLDGIDYTRYRIYANFTHPNEGVSSWGALNTPFTLVSTQLNGAPSLYGFQNIPGGGDLPPTYDDVMANHNLAFDSWYTLGLAYSDDNPNPDLYPLLSIGMPPIVQGSMILTAPQNSAAITTVPNAPFAFAGWNSYNRVLLMQILVRQGDGMKGTLGLNLIGSEAVIVVSFIIWPAPGTLAAMNETARR